MILTKTIHIYRGKLKCLNSFTILLMVLKLDGNMLRTHETIRLFGEKNPTCDCSRYDQMPYTDQVTEIAPYMRTYF